MCTFYPTVCAYTQLSVRILSDIDCSRSYSHDICWILYASSDKRSNYERGTDFSVASCQLLTRLLQSRCHWGFFCVATSFNIWDCWSLNILKVSSFLHWTWPNLCNGIHKVPEDLSFEIWKFVVELINRVYFLRSLRRRFLERARLQCLLLKIR